ncbi:MAG: hypothetical protein H7Y19_12650 [Luteimonas sp.]|nr:hypothetical protein [Luteimonas sp.]
MKSAFLPTGGILAGDCVAHIMRRGFDQPISTLARWIVNRDVVAFEERGELWVPMFQFNPDLQVRPGVRKVIEELRGVFDEWELVDWFARPNSSLCGENPASVVLCNERAVLEAAMVDRFIATG